MSANTFGNNFKVTTFGESHGEGLGCVIDGCPAGLAFDYDFLTTQLRRRRPGQSFTTPRQEADRPEILSGVFEGKTLGTPIAIIFRNQDARSQDYAPIAQQPRVGHADDVWQAKFGLRDHRGGGRASGRETVARVAAGAVAQMLLRHLVPDLEIVGFATQIGQIELSQTERGVLLSQKRQSQPYQMQQQIDEYVARFPSQQSQNQLKELLSKASHEGQSYGGFMELRVFGMPLGLGQPVFHKLKADLAHAILGVGAVTSFSLGENQSGEIKGTEFHQVPQSPYYGGIRGGISTGEDLILEVGFKPTSSVGQTALAGRHDPCIIPRAIPVIEAMVALVLADHLLLKRLDRV